ncbi:neural cell adhesion molecule 1-like isoform X2 [Saccostrea echinata]|uniref:neural cell adhesion molecule 1-like isoform X2 n=1 Tax=Saccostrea echinata TaxID=191078 RepID=UPI002A80A222|nr:neural cell adhesion molecule 1-like isoform X2 [Saccostrea echinata]
MVIQSAVMNYGELWLVLMGLVLIGGTVGQDGGVVEIMSENPLVVPGKSSTRIQCTARGVGNEGANLRWYGPDGNAIGTNLLDRVYTLSYAAGSLSVIITNVLEQDAGEYTCNGTINGTPKTAKISVSVNMPLEITEEMAPRSQKVEEGTQGLIKCTAPGGYTIAWIKDGSPIGQEHPRYSQVSEGLEINKVNRSLDEGIFICNVYGTGAASSKIEFINIQVTVTVRPKITRPPSAGQAVEGAQYRFECRASGEPSPEYHWFKDESSNELVGDRFEIDKQNGILTIKESKKDDEGLYKCEARNEAGVDSATAQLRVIIPPKIREFNNGTGEEGKDGTLRCKAYGDPIPTIKWLKGDVVLPDGAPTQDMNEKTVVSRLTISPLTKDDGGQYTCEAATQGAESDKKHAYLIVKYKPAFNPGMPTTAWTWQNAPGNLTCEVEGEPRPRVEWFSVPNENGERTPISEGGRFSITNKNKGTNTVISTLRVVYDFSVPLGEYLCKAINDLGATNRTIRLRKADPPASPSVLVVEVTPNTADFTVQFSSMANAPPPKRLKVTITSSPPQAMDPQYFDVGVVNGNPKEVKVALTGLTPSTSYTFEFAGESDAGIGVSTTKTANTPSAREPYKVVIQNPLRDGEYPNKYNLQWETPKDGGSPIQSVRICYRRVKVRPELSPTNEYQFVEQITGFVCNDAQPQQSSYMLTNLEPSTHYQVNIQARNQKGDSEDSFFIFKTKSPQLVTQPQIETSAQTQTTDSNPEPDPAFSSGEEKGGLPIGVIIAIIIIVFIVLLIVVDVTCYYKRKCGVIMCLKGKLGGGSTAGAGSGLKDAEKGGDDKDKKSDKPTEKEENTKPLLNDKTEEEAQNGKEEELKEMEPEEKEKAGEKTPTIETAEEAKPAPESPNKDTPTDTKPEEKSPTNEAKPEAPTEKKEEK